MDETLITYLQLPKRASSEEIFNIIKVFESKEGDNIDKKVNECDTENFAKQGATIAATQNTAESNFILISQNLHVYIRNTIALNKDKK